MNNADKLHELLSQINAKAQDVNGLVAEINNLAIEYEKGSRGYAGDQQTSSCGFSWAIS